MVWARPLNQRAEVVEVRGSQVTVMAGSMRMSLPQTQLGQTGASPSPSRALRGLDGRTSAERRANQIPVPQSAANAIDLRGARRDEVEAPLLEFLDQAFRAGERNVWVIHGVGTGAVRDESRAILKDVPYVESFRPGDRHEGGDGATIAWIADRD